MTRQSALLVLWFPRYDLQLMPAQGSLLTCSKLGRF